MSGISFIGFGHSHNVALAKGYYALVKKNAASFEGVPFSGSFHSLYDPPFAPVLGEGGALQPAIIEFMKNAKRQFILLSISGNEHNILSIVQHKKPFDFILDASDPALEPGVEILTRAAVRETVREWMEFNRVDAITRAFGEATALPIVLVEPPPPLPASHVRANPDIFEKALCKARVSSDALRHKIWRLQGELYLEICHKYGVRFVPVPGRLLDVNGLLVREGCGLDATHANEIFGQQMMLEILRVVSGKCPDAGRVKGSAFPDKP